MTLDTSVEIAAPVERVWSILCDFVAYPEWNPFITSIEGRQRRGARLMLRIEPPGQAPVSFRARLLRIRRRRELRWRGQLLAPGLFDGVHSFTLEVLPDNRCRFHQLEEISGVLAPMLGPGLLETTRAGLEAMNQALKARAERTPAP